MTLVEEKKALAQLEDDNLIENKYQRVGHIDEGRLCDAFVNHCRTKLPGATLPSRWKYGTSEQFIAAHGPGPYWSETKSYHNYIYKGQYVFRIWTNAGQKYALVDVSPSLAVVLGITLDVVDIPVGSRFKCRPMVHRFKATNIVDIDALIDAAKSVYGVS